MLNKGLFTSNTDQWSTPQDFYDEINREFDFQLDVCCDESNCRAPKGLTERQDGLSVDWSLYKGWKWMNPPYSDLYRWVEKCFNESLRGSKTVCLIPARTDTRAFHKFILPFSGINSADKDYAYLAGIIDGEGCIRVDKGNPTDANRLKNPTYSLMLSVKMTDKKTIDWIHKKTGVGSISLEKFDYKKTTHRWEARGESAKKILEFIYPYLITKKSQAFYGIQFQILKSEKILRKVTEKYLEEQESFYKIITDLKKDDNKNSINTEIRFIKGRLKFGGSKNSAPFPSMLVIFK